MRTQRVVAICFFFETYLQKTASFMLQPRDSVIADTTVDCMILTALCDNVKQKKSPLAFFFFFAGPT